MYAKLIPLILGIILGLPVNAQTNKNTRPAPRKTTTTNPVKTKPVSTPKTDTTASKIISPDPTSKEVKETQPALNKVSTPATQPASIPVSPAVVNTKEDAVSMPSPFKGGSLRLSHQSAITLERFTQKGISPGKDNSIDADLELTWFPINGLGIGIDARYYDSYYTTPGTISDYSSWSAYFHLLYGYSFTERYHAYVKVAYGPAKSNSKTTLGQNKQELKSSFKDLAFSAGAPIRIEKDGRLFATPAFTYDQYKGTAGTHDIKDKTSAFRIRLESYLPLRSKAIKGPTAYYAKGSQYIDYNSQLDWHSTKRFENQGPITFVPRKFNTLFFHAGYGIYVINNLAAGLDIELNNRKDINPGSADDIRKSVSLKPAVMAQVPVEGPLNHIFGQVSYEFSKGSQSGSVKTKGSTLDLRAGYHLFITKNLALTPRIGYTIDKYTASYVTSGDNITKSKGLAGELLLRAWLNRKWLK